MRIIRGTTPTITMTVNNDMDISTLVDVWVYISQGGKTKIDKKFSDLSFDYANKSMSVTLTQTDTLALKAGDALIQVRAITSDGVALGMVAQSIDIEEVYKNGIIGGVENG